MDSSVAAVSADKVAEARERVLAELRKVIVGQDEVVEQVLIALFTGGHVLITGVPGLAKTLLIKTLSDILDLDFKRIQFTPDLMPSDITGTEILDEEQGMRRLRFVKGPIFGQIILADEINRTPPKTQAALLEAMQEYHVTASGRTYDLDRPFFVLATQNPIELEGTYPLPEAQLDRFMFNVVIKYLSEDDEVTVVTRDHRCAALSAPAKILTGADIRQFQELSVPGGDCRGDRPLHRAARGRVAPGRRGRAGLHREMGEVGRRAGCGSQALVRGAKTRALMHGRYHVAVKDIQALAGPIPATPHHDQLLRRVRTHQCRRDHREAARYGPRSQERNVADAMDRARPAVSRSGGRRPSRHARAEGPNHRRRLSLGAAPQSVQGIQRRVRFEYRQYIPGDDLSTMDWKVYGAEATATTSRSSRRRPTSIAI